ncbi:aromatic ring-hydroxylating oxygenase subunit alpha [Immundisolibacter sp.]
MRMGEELLPQELAGLVDVHGATADRRVFSDPLIFELEHERVFGRAWLYIGHESEIPAVGDYVTRRMGRDPVILVRSAADRVDVLLNSCPHRGAMVCLADAGNGRGFICPYHGWAFANDGRLVATSVDDALYQGKVDMRRLDMRRAAKVATYAGLIYATWNPDAPALDDYLGEARWFMDVFFQRTPGGMVVLGAPHRWEIGVNWKIGPINFAGDGPHFTQLHGPIAHVTQGIERPVLQAALKAATAIRFGHGHNGVAQLSPADQPAAWLGLDPALVPLMRRALSPAQLDVRARLVQGVCTVFPNHSWTHNPVSFRSDEPPVSFLAMRVWQPVAVDRTQVWNWFLVEKEASESWQRKAALAGLRAFSVGGTFDQDDAETWDAMGRALAARTVDGQRISFEAVLAHRERPDPTWPGPGETFDTGYAEGSEFDVLCEWQKYMSKP